MASNGLWWSPLPASSCAWLIVSLSISASSLLGQRWAETEQAICMDQEECHSSNKYKSFYRQITQNFIFSSLRSTRDRSGLQRPYKRITVTSWLSKIHRITSWIHSSHRSQRELEGCPDLHGDQTGTQDCPNLHRRQGELQVVLTYTGIKQGDRIVLIYTGVKESYRLSWLTQGSNRDTELS